MSVAKFTLGDDFIYGEFSYNIHTHTLHAYTAITFSYMYLADEITRIYMYIVSAYTCSYNEVRLYIEVFHQRIHNIHHTTYHHCTHIACSSMDACTGSSPSYSRHTVYVLFDVTVC